MAAATLYPSILLLFVIANAFVVARASLIVSGVQVEAVNVDGLVTYFEEFDIDLLEASVSLSCDGGLTNLDQATTGPTGAFHLVATTGNGALFEQSQCGVYATLEGQSVANHNGIKLRANIGPLSIVNSGYPNAKAVAQVGTFQRV